MGGDEYVLAIDNGTQSVRAMLFDAKGWMHANVQVPLEPFVSPQPGWAEQQPDYFWDQLCRACRNLFRETGAANSIRAVSVTTQRSTLINLDARGRPLRPAILWADRRRAAGLKPMGGWFGTAARMTGAGGTLADHRAEAEANWIAKEQPEIWEATDKFLFLSGYLNYRLSGGFVDSVACQAGYVPFDYRRQRWASPGHWIWRLAPITRGMLPELKPSGAVLGTISETAAMETGIPAGLPLIAAAGDKACEVLGSGCTQPGLAHISLGTTANVNVTTTRYVEPVRLVPPYPAAIPGRFNAEVQIFRGYWMVSWFRDQFGFREQLASERMNVPVETLFDELAEAAPAGSMGLMLQPYWSPGIREPGPEAKGAIVGFGDVHNRAHIYRAILEGIAYGLREGLEQIERRTRQRSERLRVTGGGAKSNAALQLTADVFGLSSARPHVTETSGLGAAICSAVGIGWHESFDDAVIAMTREERVFEPDPERHRLYDRLYGRVYRRMYRRLQPLYREIRDITGYPES